MLILKPYLGSGERSNPFQTWFSQPKDHEHRLLWISGKSGSGKSTLMKHILNDKRTMNSLQRSEQGKWIVTPYFFHDRGPDPIQKSLEGLLQEMLYQIIQQYETAQEHLPRVRACKLLMQLRYDGFKVGNMAHCPPDGTVNDITTIMRRYHQAVPNALAALKGWAMHEVKNALREVFEHGANTLRICLLVDGLDEHQEARYEQQGGHQVLIRYLLSLAHSATFPSCHIKMVLASRAEDIFQEGFKERPRFAIHDYTKAAIHTYVCRRVQSSNCDPLLDFCDELTKKAQGVFVWVKLVVEELIEGYIAGDTISQLRNTMDSLPKKITELYQRVLVRRDPKYSSETYVMLQLVLGALAPLTLAQLMAATDANLYSGVDAMSTESMERRLASRCGGLLEIADGSQSSRPKAGNVQFSNQTVKSYVERREIIQHIFSQGQEIPLERRRI